jgi:hypothetical protein
MSAGIAISRSFLKPQAARAAWSMFFGYWFFGPAQGKFRETVIR